MKQRFLTILFLGAIVQINICAQSFPLFLEGSWKVDGKNNYEHWDLINPNSLKGFMFRMELGLPVVTEYLEIKQAGEAIVYTATVLDQNQGQSIPFTLNQDDSVYSFKNLRHDFPQVIAYKPMSDKRITVFVGTENEGFEFDLLRTGTGQEHLQQTASSTLDTLPSGELMLRQEILVKAPLEKAWKAYTTPEEWKKWVSPVVEMDFRINGTIRSHYDPGASIGDGGTIVIHILNYIPEHQITMQADIGPGFPDFIRENAENLYSIVEFEKITDNSTLIRLYGTGYRTGPEWQEFMQFFIQGNEMTLNNLKGFLETE